MKEGLTPQALRVLSEHLPGEAVSIEIEKLDDGRFHVFVDMFDEEARVLNSDPDEPTSGYEEFPRMIYILAADGSKVEEIQDRYGTLVELNPDPLPWAKA